MENQYTIKTDAAPIEVRKAGEQFAIVRADGTCEINWELCEQAAAEWKPHGEIYTAVAKLLIHARQSL